MSSWTARLALKTQVHFQQPQGVGAKCAYVCVCASMCVSVCVAASCGASLYDEKVAQTPIHPAVRQLNARRCSVRWGAVIYRIYTYLYIYIIIYIYIYICALTVGHALAGTCKRCSNCLREGVKGQDDCQKYFQRNQSFVLLLLLMVERVQLSA